MPNFIFNFSHHTTGFAAKCPGAARARPRESGAGPRVALLALWSVLLFSSVLAARDEEYANYSVVFEATWSAATHPDDFPTNAHFSPLIGGTHDSTVQFWAPGEPASDGIERMAEHGAVEPLSAEVEAAITAGSAYGVISGFGIAQSPGENALGFEISKNYPLVTLVSMLAPSPDWFVGVHGISLRENGRWLLQKKVLLYAYDAGTDDGNSYRSADLEPSPHHLITRIDGFPLFGVPVGTFTFTRSDDNAKPSTIGLGEQGRFNVDVSYSTPSGSTDIGQGVVLTQDTGYFWFFSPKNVEVIVKVLDACELGGGSTEGYYWVFVGGLTNVAVEIEVFDKATSKVRRYSNSLGHPFVPIQDTAAFSCFVCDSSCP